MDNRAKQKPLIGLQLNVWSASFDRSAKKSGCSKYQPIQSKEQGILRELPFALHGRLKAPKKTA